MLALAVFVTWSVNFLDIDLERLPDVLGRLADVLARRYYPPDLDHIWHRNYLAAVGETLQMSYAAAVVGMLIAAPLAWCASFNLSPNRVPLYPAARQLRFSRKARRC
jgi:phosphonate transport system permease protein